MEGNISIANGYYVAVGYSFTIPGSHSDVRVLMANAVVTFHGTCSNGSLDNTLSIPLRPGDPSGNPYLVPAGSSNWFPSNDEGAPESYQGSVVASVCGGTGSLNVAQGATFSADVQASPTTYKINIRFHYRVPAAKGMGNVDCSVGTHPASQCAASWSGTGSVLPDPIPASPNLTSTASADTTLGGALTDTAHLSGGNSPAGTIRFDLYGPNNASCSGTAVFSTTAAVSGNGNYTSAAYVPTAAGTYRWRVTYSGDANNAATGPTDCSDAAERVDVARRQPTLTSTASGVARHVRTRSGRRRLRISRSLGVPIHDTAHLRGSGASTGQIIFHLYGPGDTNCSRAPVFTSTIPVAGDGDYDSASYSPTDAGTHRWTVEYSGDDNTKPAGPTGCGDPTETVDVARDQPVLNSTASGTVVLGGALTDTAHLIGGTAPTGTITFHLYGPNNESCAGTAIFTSTATAAGNGNYTSGPFAPTAPGTYHWRVTYAGDSNNGPAGPTACDDLGETANVTSVAPTQPTLSSTASADTTVGNALTDTAHLSGGSSPTGTISFELYGPDDTNCSRGLAFRSAVSVVPGTTDYTSGAFTPTRAGTYRWRVIYSGDAQNAGAGPTDCGDPNETVFADRAQPSFTTTAPANAGSGQPITDTAHLSGGVAPTGTITFRLYGPADTDDCSDNTLVFSDTVQVAGNSAYTSPAFTPQRAGTYRWVAEYSGDANNVGAGPTGCGEAGEVTNVPRAEPTIISLASGATVRRLAANRLAGATGGRIGKHRRRVGRRFRALGLPMHDTARLSGGKNPTGFITFSLYGPDDAGCAGTPFVTRTEVTGSNGDYLSEQFVPTEPGTYRWVAEYSGDLNNKPAGPTKCGDLAETVVIVAPAQPALSSTASPAVTLGGALTDTAHLSGGEAATGMITFRLYGPNDANCSGPVRFTSTAAVNGDGDYTSGSYTPTTTGTFRWRVSYSGDPNNNAVAATACDATGESAEVRPPDVTPVEVGFSTTVPESTVGVGVPISDLAHLVGGASPSGSVSFALYGPDDPTCTGSPAFTSQIAVAGEGDYSSGLFVVSQPGTYSWIASYSGDKANAPAGPTACGEAAETLTVTATPDINPNPPVTPPDESEIAGEQTKPRPSKPKHRRPKHKTAPQFTG